MSVDSVGSQNDLVEQALHAMYYSHREGERKSAMKFLESFQNSQAAWQLSMHVLSNPSQFRAEAVFFAAQTLKHKIVSDLNQLDETDHIAVRDLLYQLAYQPSLLKALRTQILLGLAALLAQTKLELVRGPDDQVYVELLAVVPEQLNNRLIHLSDESYRERKEALLINNSLAAINMFLNVLGEDEWRRVAVDGLRNWIHYADLTNEQSLHILQVAIRLLTVEANDELVEGLCELIVELVHQNAENAAFFSVFTHYTPHLCNLVCEIDGNLGREKALGSMIVECSELYLSQLLTAPNALQSLIPAILKLSASSEMSICELPFNFWTDLEVILESTPQEMRDAFVPVYTHLFSVLLPRVQYKTGHQSAEEKEAFRDFRHVIGDCLKDCVRVIGSTAAVDLLWAAFISAHQSPGWQASEAVLFALRTCASVIDRRESEKLPAFFPLLLQMNGHPKLVYSTLLAIGCLADWVKYHPDLLADAVEYITRGLTVQGDSEITAAAAMSMRYLCESCSGRMVGFLDNLLQMNKNVLRRIDRADQISLTESICHVIIADSCNVGKVLPIAVEPFIGGLNDPNGESVDCSLEHLATFIELVVPDAASLIGPEWPMTSLYLGSIEPMIEPIARQHLHVVENGLAGVCKAAISRYSRSLGQSWLHGMVQRLQGLFHAGVLGTAVYILRYAVLLGECGDPVQQPIITDLRLGFANYSQKPLDCLNLLVSMFDYWRSVNDPQLIDMALHLGCALCADPSTDAAELSACIILAVRIAVALGTTNQLYQQLVKTILRSSLLSFPPAVQSDAATLLHRLGRTSALTEVLLNEVLMEMGGIVPERERAAWLEQCREALKEPRQRPMKNTLVNWAAAVRRRN